MEKEYKGSFLISHDAIVLGVSGHSMLYFAMDAQYIIFTDFLECFTLTVATAK